jgi:multidrug efflux pump subunit AcrA (membrane-fusion protein)
MRKPISGVLAVAFLFSAGCTKPAAEEASAPAPVQVTAVTQATIRRIVAGDGTLFPEDQASIVPKIAAPVQKFYVQRGDHVKQGQLLAVLENRDLMAAAAESKAALEQAESNLRATQGAAVPEALVKAKIDLDAARDTRDAAKKVLDSREQLFKQGALSGRQVDESQLAYSQAAGQYKAAEEHWKTLQSVANEEQLKGAAAQVESAKAHYQSQQAQVAYSRVVSPISGVISDRPLNAGEMVSPGTPMLTVVDISRVVARVNVPQAESGTVKVGQTAILTQTGKSGEVEGKVLVVSPATDPSSTTIEVWVQVPNPGELLKPGSSVHAAIVTEIYKAATVVPEGAILPGEEGGTALLTVGSDSLAHRRPAKLGVREGNQVQILSGVRPGEEVIVAGGLGLDDKAKVKVITTAVEESDDDEDSDAPQQPSPAKPKKDEQKTKGQ